MKKILLLATALMFGTAAMAQDTGAQAPMANQPMGPGAQSPAPDTTMPATTDTPMAAPADTAAPVGTTAPMPADQAPMASTTDYPPCSRTVTDKCVSGKSSMKGKSGKHRAMAKKAM